ncbi:uncharacterized protein LOC128877917 [Hylaeus volcanicus]|uniref:uncharacterized protein LOC128877917 n=1 Tax=Hylaeus volcanicus TaxID=313075 RepID=UPI0023B84D66|nr:uncharacterized protein LOC128877917 [Hylaeus volcanicus]XP_053981678.1 uncharacterized protein LOC128877917 [Hylaeus volcanicus]
MKDFSIESILSDTLVFKQSNRFEKKFRSENYENFKKENDWKRFEANLKISVEETRAFSMKNNCGCIEEKSVIIKEEMCTKIDSRKTHEFCERESGDVSLKKHTASEMKRKREINFRKSPRGSLIDKLFINSKEPDKHKPYKNSLVLGEFQDTRREKKFTSDILNGICRTFDVIDAKPNVAIPRVGRSTQIDVTTELRAQENFDLIETNGTNTAERISEECNTDSNKFQVEECNYRDTDKNNYWKNAKINDQLKKDSGRNLKKGQRKLNRNRKRQIKTDESGMFNNSQINDLNLNENRSELLGIQTKCTKDNLSRKSEEMESKDSLSDNQNRKLVESFEDETEGLKVMQKLKKLEWLQFTRYRPPKIHRKSTIGRNKRKASLQPRIPFSTFQIDFLEQKFRNSAYLSRNDVLDISLNLKLPPKKVKIWFQNRRARERREFHANTQ